MKNEYVCLKLTNGDTIIGMLDTECDEYITVDNPTILEYGHDHEGNLGIKFLLYMPYSTETLFTFAQKYVMLKGDVSQRIQDYYESFIMAENEKDGIPTIDKSKLH